MHGKCILAPDATSQKPQESTEVSDCALALATLRVGNVDNDLAGEEHMAAAVKSTMSEFRAVIGQRKKQAVTQP